MPKKIPRCYPQHSPLTVRDREDLYALSYALGKQCCIVIFSKNPFLIVIITNGSALLHLAFMSPSIRDENLFSADFSSKYHGLNQRTYGKAFCHGPLAMAGMTLAILSK